jgi:hypothetical protein
VICLTINLLRALYNVAVVLFRPRKSPRLIVGNYEISVYKNRPNDPEVATEGRARSPPLQLGYFSLSNFSERR